MIRQFSRDHLTIGCSRRGDRAAAELPHKGTLLYSVEIPSHGGETLFASGYAAYETLPDEIREPLEEQPENEPDFGGEKAQIRIVVPLPVGAEKAQIRIVVPLPEGGRLDVTGTFEE